MQSACAGGSAFPVLVKDQCRRLRGASTLIPMSGGWYSAKGWLLPENHRSDVSSHSVVYFLWALLILDSTANKI